MPIPNSGQISLNDDVNATLQADSNESNVSLGDNNTVKFTAVGDGDTVSGRSMSELRGQTLFQINPTTEETGWLGESLHMDGITSNHNSVKVLEPGLTTAPVFTNTKGTFSLWVKIHKTTSSNRYLYTSGTSSSNSLVAILLHSSGTNHKLYIRIDGVYFTSQATFIDKAGWYNFVISLDSSILMDREKIKAYANGIPLHWESVGNLTDNQAFQFGTNQRINDWAFSPGYGADATYGNFIFVDGSALLPNEFGELVHGIWVPKAVNKQSSDTLITTNLVADYQFQGNSNDTSGSSTTYNGTASNVTFKQNNYGVATFTGGSASRISLGASNQFAGTALTLSFWYMPTAATGGGYKIVFSNYTTGSPNFNMSRNADHSLEIGVSAGSSGTWYRKTAPDAIKMNIWTQVTIVFDSSQSAEADKTKIYINGGDFYHFNNTGSGGTGNWLDTSNTLYIGDWDHQTGYTDTSKFGEVQIYTSALTAANVLQNYNATKHKYFYGLNGWHFNLNNTDTGSVITPGSDLKLHLDAGDWDADGTDETSFSGTAWSDKSGNSNNGTVSGATYSTDNGGCFSFNGSSHYVKINDSIFNNSSDTDITWSCWLRLDSTWTSGFRSPVGSTASNGYRGAIAINMYGTGSGITTSLERYYNNTQRYASVYGTSAGLYTYAVDTWYHQTIVYDASTNNATIYINGSQIGSSYNLNTVNSQTTVNETSIGMYGSGYSNNGWAGDIAQIRCYDKALTAQEVVQNFRATQGHYGVLSLADISGNAKGGIANGTNLTGADHTGDKSNVSYATLSENAKSTSVTLSDGGHALTHTVSGWRGGVGTRAVSSGKWYYEVKITSVNTSGATANSAYFMAGWQKAEAVGDWDDSPYSTYNNVIVVFGSGSFGIISSGTSPHYGTSNINGGSVFALNDVLGIALNADTGAVQIYKNGSALGSAVTLTADEYVVFYSKWSSTHDNATFNFGARGFAHTPPSGYLALSSDNIPTANNVDPVNKKKPSDYFSTVLYNGNGGTTKSITGVGFQPDLVWIKDRDDTENHAIFDSIRGENLWLHPNTNAAETDYSGQYGLLGFEEDGFKVGNGTALNAAENYVAWCWKASGSEETLTGSGSNNSVIASVNDDAGFSILKYEGTGSSGMKIRHGLSAAPAMVMVKKRDANPAAWMVWFHQGLTDFDYYLTLNTGDQQTDSVGTGFSAAPDANLLTFGTSGIGNDNNLRYVAYCWRNVDGYSKIYSYRGNGSSVGPVVYTGFKPAFLMIKRADSSANWRILDNKRSETNILSGELYPNLTNTEGDYNAVNFLSNGFQIVNSDTSYNASGGTYIYMAIAEDPAKYSQGFGQELRDVEKFLEKGTGSTEYPANHFQIARYTGTNAKQKIELNFSPGLTWFKALSDARTHSLVDSVRGFNGSSARVLQSDSNSAQWDSAYINSFDADGFTISGSENYINNSSHNYISWNWKAGDTQVTKKPTYTSSGILTSNLALHYNFADSNTYSGSGTTVYDLTSNDNDATLNNSPSWVDKENGNYFDLDGSNDFIECTTIKDDVDDGQSVSMEVWFKCSSSQSGEGIICGFGGSYGDAGMDIGVKPSTGLLYISQGSGSYGVGYDIRDNKWHHAVMTMTSSAKSLYLDGILIDSSAATNRGTFPNDFHIGTWADDAYNGYYYKGAVGQVRIYTAELTQSQIRANYDATRTLYQGVGTTGNVLQTGLLNNIDVDSFSSYDPNSFGITNKVAVFNGSSSLIAIGSPIPNTDTDTAISAWVRLDSGVSSHMHITGTGVTTALSEAPFRATLSYVSSNTFKLFALRQVGGTYYLAGTSGLNNVTILPDVWYHVVWSYDATGRQLSTFLNGVAIDSNVAMSTTGSSVNNSTTVIGSFRSTSGPFFDGSIDTLRMFSSVLTADQAKILYNETSSTTGTLNPTGISNCIALYNFNSDSGTAVDDVSTNFDGTASNVTFEEDNTTSHRIKDQTSNNLSLGSLVNTTINESNSWGTSLKYDGTGDYVTLPIGLGRTATQDVTREFWVKVDDYPGSGDKDTLFYCGDMSANQYYETIAVRPDGTLQYQERAGNSSTNGLNNGDGLSTPADNLILHENEWVHVAYTISGGTKTIYINGKLAISKTFSDTKVNNSAYGGSLGSFRGSTVASFQGEIAQFRSYTSALTRAQIKANYDATRPQFFTALTHSLVSVNEKAGFSIVKYTGNATSGATISHGLSAAPNLIITKRLDSTGDWLVYHSSLGATKYLIMNVDDRAYTVSNVWNDTAPTSTVFSIGNYAEINTSGGQYIAYCWTSILGYSKIGEYTGKTAGVTIYTGFQPRFIMIKAFEGSYDEHWAILDAARGSEKVINPNRTNAEGDSALNTFTTSPTSFSFPHQNTADAMLNENGVKYIYMAFA